MFVAFADAGVNTLYLDFKRNFTVFEIVGIEKKRAGIVGEPTADLGIDVIDTEIEIGMFLVNFPGTGFGMPGEIRIIRPERRGRGETAFSCS
jgi:hypothetical protein